MKTIFPLLFLFFLISCSGAAQNSSKDKKNYKIKKTDAEWKNQLTARQYYILREAGTERAFSSSYDKNFKK